MISHEAFGEFAPYIIMAIIFALQYKVFMTPADFQKEKAEFMKYIAENYVSDKIYRDNHSVLNDQLVELGRKTDLRLDRIDEKIDDIKNLLIQKGE